MSTGTHIRNQGIYTHPKSMMVNPDTNFQLGQDVLFTDGKGSQARVVYEGATPDGLWHTLRRDN